MTTDDAKISVLLTGGEDDRTFAELVAPVVSQGQAPKLARSVNTRHGIIPGTCVRSPMFTPVGPGVAGRECHGIIPSTTGKAAALCFTPGAGGSRILSDAGRGSYGGLLLSQSDSTKLQSSYIPTQILDAGAIPSVAASSNIAACYQSSTGLVFYAYCAPNRATPTSRDIYVAVTSVDGKLAAPPRIITTIAATAREWVGLTDHGVNQIRLWYIDGGNLMVSKLLLTNNVISPLTFVTVVALGNPAVEMDVVRVDDTYAMILHSGTGSGYDAILRKFNVFNSTTASTVTLSLYFALRGQGALAVETIGGTQYVAIACSDGLNNNRIELYNVATMASAMSGVNLTGFNNLDYLAVRFLNTTQTGPCISVAHSAKAGFSFDQFSGTCRTDFWTIAIPGGTTTRSASVQWTGIQNRGAQYRNANGELYPLYFLSRVYGDSVANYPNDVVDDPSIEMYLHGNSDTCSPVARFGCVRGTILAPARTAYEAFLASNSCVELGAGEVLCTYRKDNTGAAPGGTASYVGRFVRLSLNGYQPRIAQDKDGLALVASALPTQWDGVEFVEMCGPLHSPHIYTTIVSSTSTLSSGPYSFVAVYQWSDAAGLVHRSRPSRIATVNLATSNNLVIQVRVPRPDTLRNGTNQAPVDVLIYSRDSGSATYNLRAQLPSTYTADSWTFLYSTPTDTSLPVIYSTGTNGEEQTPQPPCPLFDVAIVQSRAWGIDAEVRSRLVYSKLRVAGVGFEWCPTYEVPFPSGAGRLMAVREFQGQALVLAERAVFTVAGDGPSNQIGNAGSFAQPVKISDFGCSNENSVVSTPVGIFWQDGSRLMLFNGSAVASVPEVKLSQTLSGALLLRNQREVIFCTSALATIKVGCYDTGQMCWSTWDYQTLGYAVQNAVSVPYDTDTSLVYCQGDGNVYRLDAASVGNAQNMTWETGWTCLGGDFQDSVIIRRVIFNGLRSGRHSLTTFLQENYEQSSSTTRPWTADVIDALADAGLRYSVRFEPAKQQSRALKVTVQDTIDVLAPTAGVQPRSLTLIYAVDDMVHEPSFVQGTSQ